MTTTTFADGLLGRAYRSLDKAASATTPNAIFASSFLAASQAAAAIISSRITPEQAARMRRPNTLWEALTIADPNLAEWAQHFATRARQRDLADKNVAYAVYRDQAEQLLQDASQFIELAEGIVSEGANSHAG